MLVNILIGVVIFGYAGWTLYRYIKSSKEGKCAKCASRKTCSTDTKC